MSEVFNQSVLEAINKALQDGISTTALEVDGTPQYCVINAETREIEIPGELNIFGVESDEKSTRVYFRCPKYVGTNVDIDMTKCMVYVPYKNANGEKDQYIVTDLNETEDGENVEFTWLISRKASAYRGIAEFGVRAIKTATGGVIEAEWNTTVASANILRGMDVGLLEFSEENTDALAQALDLINQELEQTKNEMNSEIETKGQQTLATIPDDYTTAAQNALSAKNEVEDIRVGADGVNYDSAGNAVRNQLGTIVEYSSLVAKRSVYDYTGDTFVLLNSIENHTYLVLFSHYTKNLSVRNFGGISWSDYGTVVTEKALYSKITTTVNGELRLHIEGNYYFTGTCVIFDITENPSLEQSLIENGFLGSVSKGLIHDLFTLTNNQTSELKDTIKNIIGDVSTPNVIYKADNYGGYDYEILKVEESIKKTFIAVFSSDTPGVSIRLLGDVGLWIVSGNDTTDAIHYSKIVTNNLGSLRLNTEDNVRYTGSVAVFDCTGNTELEEFLIANQWGGVNKVYSGDFRTIKEDISIVKKTFDETFTTIDNLFYDVTPSGTPVNGTGDFDIDGCNINASVESDSWYRGTSLLLENEKTYAYQLDLVGTGTSENYNVSLRVFNDSSGGWKFSAPDHSQTTGTTIRVTGIIGPLSISDGENILSINVENSVGTKITGTVKIVDVSDKTEIFIENIPWDSLQDTTAMLKLSGGGEQGNHPWKDKKIVFYGDSITEQGIYPSYVKNVTGCISIVQGVGGSTIANGDTNNNSLSSDTRLNGIPEDADMVMIMGGTNDWENSVIGDAISYDNGFSRKNVKNALAYIIQKISERCPNALIVVATNIGGRGNQGEIQPLPQRASVGVGEGNTPYMIRNAEIEVAEYMNVPVCDTWSCGINGFNRLKYISDTVHPTEAGAELIANYIVGFLQTVFPKTKNIK